MSVFASILSAKSFQDTISRFPLSRLFAVLLFSLIVTENHNRDFLHEMERYAAFFTGGFFISGFFVLLSESLSISAVKK